MKSAVHLSSLPQAALQNDLENLHGLNAIALCDAHGWESVFRDLQTNIYLDPKSLKSARVTKLNNMAEWELEEIEHEQNYLKAQQQNQHEDESNSK